MSFSSSQKIRIITEQYKNSCCRKAMLQGILFSKASVIGNDVSLSLEKNEYCDFFSKLTYEHFGVESLITSSKSGGRLKNIGSLF